ncbi:MAG: hypothetical protein Q7V05_10525 [Methanoregula sp.]|nr:hypothetical protein [Methanoregula sp.]
MRYVVERNSLICGLFTVLLFTAYFCGMFFGESFWLTLTLVIGIAGLVIGAILTRNTRVFGLPSWQTNPFHFSLVMTVFYFIAQYISFFFHEWSHSTAAFLTGKTHVEPLDIDYGHGWTFSGCHAINQSIYPEWIEHGQNTTAAIIAIAGPMMNVFLAVIALILLTRERVRSSLLLFSLLFWFALHNLGQLWSYIPQRSVWHEGGDIYFFEWATGLSPWAVTVAGTILIIAGFILVFVYLLPALTASLRPALLGLAGLFVLGWFAVFIRYGLGPLVEMVDAWVLTNPQAWFAPFDLAVGIIIAWLSIREIKRKYDKNPWLKLREDT